MQTDSRSRGRSESYSQNNQRLGRELMTPSELATMPGDKCILQLRGLPPFYSPKYDLKKHPNCRYTAEADKKKNAFDLDRLINRKRRPGPDELCEVYAVAVPDDGLTSEDEDILNYSRLNLYVETLIARFISPIRPGRSRPRNVAAKKAVSFIYRIA